MTDSWTTFQNKLTQAGGKTLHDNKRHIQTLTPLSTAFHEDVATQLVLAWGRDWGRYEVLELLQERDIPADPEDVDIIIQLRDQSKLVVVFE